MVELEPLICGRYVCFTHFITILPIVSKTKENLKQ